MRLSSYHVNDHMHYHSQNLKKVDRTNDWLNWRCWLHFTDRTEFHMQVVSPGRGLALELDLAQEESTIGGRISIPYLISIYWGVESRGPLNRFLEYITRRKDQKYSNGRTIGFYISGSDLRSGLSLSLSLWYDPMETRSEDPKWWHVYKNLNDVFLGRAKCTTETIEERYIDVPMPEGSYPGYAKLVRYTWKRRWTSKSLMRVQIDVPIGIPHEGKGENSWDMGVDRTYGITTGECRSIALGVGKLVGSVLHDRVRYGGWGDYKWHKNLKASV